ncbi:DHHW family protein [Pseudoneobacillus sp. C159]
MNKILIGIFVSFIGGLGLLHVLVDDRSFSEQENRVLAQMPSFTFKSFLSGDFTKDFEEYVSDQFVWKDFWTGMKAEAEMASLKQENDGVFFGKDGFLLEGYEKPGEQFQKNLNSIQYFKEKANDIHTYLLLAPTSVEMYKDKLPLFANSYSQKEMLAFAKEHLTVNFIDVYDKLLEKKEEPIYFRTDHHWTMRGAYYAYEVAAKEMGIAAYKWTDFTIHNVSNNFNGTYYSKANNHRIKSDRIEVFEPKFDVKYNVKYENNQNSTDSLYEWNYLTKKDQYSFFLGGNHSLVKIQSSVHNGRKLAVMKDSYAHSFIPFLANHFEEIHVIDLRYYHSNIYEYMKENDINDALFLYNIANFSKDTNMIWLER